MGDQEEIEWITSQCLQNYTENDEETQIASNDLEDYFKEEKQASPNKEFYSMSLEERKEFLKHLYTKNQLYILNSKEIVYIMLCSFLERGSFLTNRMIQSRLGFIPKQGEKNMGLWIVEHINKKYDDSEFLKSMRKIIRESNKIFVDKSDSNNSNNREEIIQNTSNTSNNIESFNENINSSLNNEDDDYKKNNLDTTAESPRERPCRLTFNNDTLKFQQFAKILDPNNSFEENGIMNSDLEQYVINLQKKYSLAIDGLITYESFKCMNIEIKEKDPTFKLIDEFLEKNDPFKVNDKQKKIIYSKKKKELICQDQSQSQQKEEEVEEKVGGIKLNTKCNHVKKILGFKIMPDKSLRFLVDKREESPEDSGVDSEDLALCLSIYLDKSIRHKNISFSLDQWDETNPRGPFQRKVFYPDVHENKKIYEGSKFGELMFECDFLMKQMSMGVQGDSKTVFDYPESLKNKGFSKDLIQKSEEEKKIVSDNWSRKWLICKQIDGLIDPNKKGIFLDQNVKVEIDARQMIVDQSGKLVDNPNQDPNHSCYKFASKMTELYDDICKEYPCFEKLKKLYKAAAMAKWIADSGVPVDLKKVQEIAKKQFEGSENFTNKIDALSFTHVYQLPDTIKREPIDARKKAIESLIFSNMEVNEEKIEFAINQLAEKNGGSREFFKTITTSHTSSQSVFGGVEMICEIKPYAKREDLDSSLSDASTTYTSINDEKIRSISEEEDFIFSIDTCCKVCQTKLSPNETWYPFQDEYYCKNHHPRTCYYCMNRIKVGAVYFDGKKETYNAESYVGKQVYFHSNCADIFQQKCLQVNRKKNNLDWVSRSNTSWITHLQKYNMKIEKIQDIKLKKPKPFICENCQKLNHRNETIICSSCGVLNHDLANIFLNQH